MRLSSASSNVDRISLAVWVTYFSLPEGLETMRMYVSNFVPGVRGGLSPFHASGELKLKALAGRVRSVWTFLWWLSLCRELFS
jgi:hypothetical protein